MAIATHSYVILRFRECMMNLDHLPSARRSWHPSPLELRHWLDQVARCSAPVLLIGKCREDLVAFAKAIHAGSVRREKGFVSARCGLYRGHLLERRFFGRGGTHAKAHIRRLVSQAGHVEEAHGGTLYVEQLQHATRAMQEGLLRLLTGRPLIDPLTGATVESYTRIIATVQSRNTRSRTSRSCNARDMWS